MYDLPSKQGLEKAKEAVALAPEDPLNWETPGDWEDAPVFGGNS